MKKLLLSAVALVVGCAPAIDPAMQMATDALLAKHGDSGATFDPPEGAAPPPWAVGQWAMYAGVDGDGRPNVQRFAIVDKDDDCGWWQETTIQGYTGVTRSRVCWTKQPELSDIESGRKLSSIVSVVETEADGQVTRMDLRKPEYAFMRDMQATQYEAIIRGLRVTAATPRETITVPAGTFNDLLKIESTVTYGPFRIDSVTWASNEIPVMGTVRSETKDGKSQMKLIAYGTEGASRGDWP
jgi:hypothetical protein